MRINAVPVTSFEIRWFLEGSVAQQDGVRRWFRSVEPWPGRQFAAAERVQTDAGSGGRTDVYLVIPGATDLGVKWYEGTLQVMGRMNAAGLQPFCGRFQGRIERWVAWSYDDLSAFYRSVFSTPPQGVVPVPVWTNRVVRKVRLDVHTGKAEEVGSAVPVERGLTMELTDIEVNSTTFCSLAFKAFPDYAGAADRLVAEVSACLASLKHVHLGAGNSQSYPAWLGTIAGCNARPVPIPAGGRRLAATR